LALLSGPLILPHIGAPVKNIPRKLLKTLKVYLANAQGMLSFSLAAPKQSERDQMLELARQCARFAFSERF
jgi:hypothetical protein